MIVFQCCAAASRRMFCASPCVVAGSGVKQVADDSGWRSLHNLAGLPLLR